MDHKGRVIATVETAGSGVAELTCNEPGGWKFDFSASVDAGRDVVTVRLSSPVDAKPPQFGVFFRVPGAEVQNVWTSNFTTGFNVWPQLWWGVADFAAPARVELYDVFGRPAGGTSVAAGLVGLAVPASGYAKVIW